MDNATREEWEAWKSWCNEFNCVTEQDINQDKFSRLASLIKVWGEKFYEMHRARELSQRGEKT